MNKNGSHLPSLVLLAALCAAGPGPVLAQEAQIDLPGTTLPGYARAVRGEELRYHSPLRDPDRSLLVRSLKREYSIAWETAPVPAGLAGDTAVFVMAAGIDVNPEERRFDLSIDGELVLSFRNPVAAAPGVIVWTGERGVRAEFRVTLVDKYGDAMGFIFLSVPRGLWKEGRPLGLEVAGESADSRAWFMVFQQSVAPRIALQNAPALLRGPQGARQVVRVEVLHLGERGRLRMTSPIGGLDTTLVLGRNRFQLAVPAVESDATVSLSFEVDGRRAESAFTLRPVRRLDLYLIHHTHLDIGYTHHQDEVERLQWRHLEDALSYGAAAEGYPEGARFIWNPEGLWAVESYLERHSAAQGERLLEGVRRGWIALDGMFANLLTGIASSEGLMRSMTAAGRLSRLSGVPIESAMLSDIPGFSWGLVPTLAQHGIRYLSIGPNYGHRIGFFLDTWGDRPFYWESPSGRERVLTWVSGAGYSWFHSGLGYERLTKRLDEENVFKYVDQLVAGAYPYDIAYMRYNIGSDNGPPDPTLADAVREWNERYLAPRLVISTVTQLFRAFEARYGPELPAFRGDMTGYWEDGAASSARETASARRTAESLLQTEMLTAMLGVALPSQDLYQAWRNVVLFYEHTWGSWNSISEPRSEFTLGQWRRKKAFADSAAAQAAQLRRRALAARRDPVAGAGLVEVVNTASWPRSDVVILPASASAIGDRVLDESGRPVLAQRLHTGELAFRAEAVPAFGARRYRVEAGSAAPRAALPGPGTRYNIIANRDFRIEIDTLRGTITSLFYRPLSWDLASARTGAGLNQYVYVTGRDPADTSSIGSVNVFTTESGPLVWAIQVAAAAPGSVAGVRSEIRVYDGIERVDILNFVDKALVYEPEAVLYRFPFNVREPEVRVDVPWGSYRPEVEQLAGASKNYLTVERWVDVHDRRAGVTLASIDAPLIQLGVIGTDAVVYGWRRELEPSATLFSYVMNNYWETNYKAAQDGGHEFRYSLRPHAAFDEAEAERFGTEVGQPLIVLPVRRDAPPLRPPFRLEARRTVVSSLLPAEDGGLVARLFNPSAEADTVRLRAADDGSLVVQRADVHGQPVVALDGDVVLGPYEILTVRLSRRPALEAGRAPAWPRQGSLGG